MWTSCFTIPKNPSFWSCCVHISHWLLSPCAFQMSYHICVYKRKYKKYFNIIRLILQKSNKNNSCKNEDFSFTFFLKKKYDAEFKTKIWWKQTLWHVQNKNPSHTTFNHIWRKGEVRPFSHTTMHYICICETDTLYAYPNENDKFII